MVSSFLCALCDLQLSFVTSSVAQVKELSEFHPSWWRSSVTESMSVLTDLATSGSLSSELTNCPRTAAVLGEMAAQWQQMMGTHQRVEQEVVSSQSLANAVENINKMRIDATGGQLRLKDGERLYPKSWPGSASLAGFAREVAAWLACVDPKHEAGKLIQRTTKGALPRRGPMVITLKTTSVSKWTSSWRWHWSMRQKAQQGPQS